jgi:hypothetical protein
MRRNEPCFSRKTHRTIRGTDKQELFPKAIRFDPLKLAQMKASGRLPLSYVSLDWKEIELDRKLAGALGPFSQRSDCGWPPQGDRPKLRAGKYRFRLLSNDKSTCRRSFSRLNLVKIQDGDNTDDNNNEECKVS